MGSNLSVSFISLSPCGILSAPKQLKLFASVLGDIQSHIFSSRIRKAHDPIHSAYHDEGVDLRMHRRPLSVPESCDRLGSARHGRGCGGTTGIFATTSINSYAGLIEGSFHQLSVQIMAAGASVVYAFVMTLILAKLVDRVMGLRVSEEEEYVWDWISPSTGRKLMLEGCLRGEKEMPQGDRR